MDKTEKSGAKSKGGRPKGLAHVATRDRNRLIANSKIKPLQVLMDVMASRWEEAQAAKDPATRKELELAACQVAEKVAPYLHPKLQATTLKGDAANPVSFVLSLPTAEELRKAVRGE